ncbi:MAG: aminotransferase class III-fold pyridoxal phosphate-dependent enzyme [Gammaproteobacteria bacterium]
MNKVRLTMTQTDSTSLNTARIASKTSPGKSTSSKQTTNTRAENLYQATRSHILRDGLQLVLDPIRSHGATIINALNGRDYINFHGGYRSNALGENHPGFTAQDYENIARATINKQAHAHIYTPDQLQAINTIAQRYMQPAGFERAFFIDGGALALENALKIALRNHALNRQTENSDTLQTDALQDGVIIGMHGAFHGHSGLTMTLSRSDPSKAEFMPRLPWPAVPTPYQERDVSACVYALEKQLAEYAPRVAGLVIEPIQCEGGDRFIPKSYFVALRRLADAHHFSLIYDETQTGFFVTGRAFAFQALNLPAPDLICGAKKSSIGYVFANHRVLAVPHNAFEVSGKINSTWGGHGGDYLVCARKLELIEQYKLAEHAQRQGRKLLEKLANLSAHYPSLIVAPRGLGLLIAIDCPSGEIRDRLIAECFKQRLLLLTGGVPKAGPFTVRFGPPLSVTDDEVETGMARFEKALCELRNALRPPGSKCHPPLITNE